MAKRVKGGTKVIVDRCNPSMGDRKEWLGLLKHKSPEETAAVFFDVDPSECVRRVRTRQGHPTLRADGKTDVERIIYGFQKHLQPPTLREGFGRVLTIGNVHSNGARTGKRTGMQKGKGWEAEAKPAAAREREREWGKERRKGKQPQEGDERVQQINKSPEEIADRIGTFLGIKKMRADPAAACTPASVPSPARAFAGGTAAAARGCLKPAPMPTAAVLGAPTVESVGRALEGLAFSEAALGARLYVADRLNALAAAAFPGMYTIVLVGSAGAGIATKGSDLDFTLLDTVGAAAPGGVVISEPAPRHAAEAALLQKVASALKESGEFANVEIVVTRTAAPSLVKCVFAGAEEAIEIDISIRHGTGGAVAGLYKSELLQAFAKASPLFRPITVLVKQWAKSRGMTVG